MAVVGAGRMGANIALRLHDRGYPVTAVYDVREEAAARTAAEIGARHARTLAEVTSLAEIVLTVVSDDTAMHAIFAESGDSLLAGAAGTTFVNTATVTPAVHVEIERRARAAGADSLEACMASSITQARDGTLYLMIGGNHAAFERVRPLLEALSSSLRYIGPAGTAAQVKALVNMVMNVNTAGLAEGLGLGDALAVEVPRDPRGGPVKAVTVEAAAHVRHSNRRLLTAKLAGRICPVQRHMQRRWIVAEHLDDIDFRLPTGCLDMRHQPECGPKTFAGRELCPDLEIAI